MRIYPNFGHEIELREKIKQIVGKGGVFIDVGANVGVYTIDLAPYFDKVYAIEPWPEYAENLRKNLKDYNINNVEVIEIAAWDFNGVVCIGVERYDDGVEVPKVGSGEILVKSVRLDDIIKEPFKFLKVDVEGEGIHVLRGMERLLRISNGYIQMEVHNHNESHGTFVFLRNLGWKLINTFNENSYGDKYHAHKLYGK